MNPQKTYTKPIAAAVLGAIIAAPLGALATYNVRAESPAHTVQAPVQTAPATGNPNAVLPDFSTMVQKYGPAVVNISIVSKVPTSYTPGEQGSDDDEDSGPQEQNPFGGQNPFAPFFRGFPTPPQQQMPMHGEGSGFIVSADGTILTNAHV